MTIKYDEISSRTFKTKYGLLKGVVINLKPKFGSLAEKGKDIGIKATDFRKVEAYFGVPYGSPPLGPLRCVIGSTYSPKMFSQRKYSLIIPDSCLQFRQLNGEELK